MLVTALEQKDAKGKPLTHFTTLFVTRVSNGICPCLRQTSQTSQRRVALFLQQVLFRCYATICLCGGTYCWPSSPATTKNAEREREREFSASDKLKHFCSSTNNNAGTSPFIPNRFTSHPSFPSGTCDSSYSEKGPMLQCSLQPHTIALLEPPPPSTQWLSFPSIHPGRTNSSPVQGLLELVLKSYYIPLSLFLLFF